jgi:hypothetical protein
MIFSYGIGMAIPPRVCGIQGRKSERHKYVAFACYGARLHGDESGSVYRRRNLFGSRLLEPDEQGVLAERREKIQDAYLLDPARWEVVLAAIRARKI